MKKKIFLAILCIIILNCAYAELAWEYGIYIKKLIADTNTLVNKDNPLDKGYEPHDLVAIKLRKSSGVEMKGRKVAVDALTQLFEAAQNDGITLFVKSAYRSYSTQNTMYANRLEKKQRC